MIHVQFVETARAASCYIEGTRYWIISNLVLKKFIEPKVCTNIHPNPTEHMTTKIVLGPIHIIWSYPRLHFLLLLYPLYTTEAAAYTSGEEAIIQPHKTTAIPSNINNLNSYASVILFPAFATCHMKGTRYWYILIICRNSLALV